MEITMIPPRRKILRTATASPVLLMGWGVPLQAGERPAVIESLSSKGLAQLQEFPVDGKLRGFAGMANQRPVAVYVLPDGSAIVGNRLDRNGIPLDAKEVQQATSKPMNDAALHDLANARWVADGAAKAQRIVYVITDPSCKWCHKFWEAARPCVSSGKVQLRHILVGLIKDDSMAKAAAILQAANPPEMLERNELSAIRGGIAPAASVTEDSRQWLMRHRRLMESQGFSGTPAIFYPGAGGLERIAGFPGPRMAEVMGPL